MPTKRRRSPKVKKQEHHYIEKLLQEVQEGKIILELGANQRIFSQGDPATTLFFIEDGKVRISVVSAAGKEVTLSILGPREFFGEGCLVGQTVRIGTATALEASKIFRIDKSALTRVVHSRPEFAETFVSLLLARTIALEEDLCDQLFNQSEKRLARALLKLSRLGNDQVTPDVEITELNHEILAEMIGTTRPRVTFFMNKFRQLGLIDYNPDGIIVRTALLTDMVLSD